MIETCKRYITCRGKETIWSQDKANIHRKLTNCIQLNHIYHETYYALKAQPFLPNQTPFAFSENFVFGKFDTFCVRLSKIIEMFNLIDDYNQLFERRLEGLLLGEALEDAIVNFDESKKIIVSKKYDYLDHRNIQFNQDHEQFMTKTNNLKTSIANLIEFNFDSVWETPQCIRFLVRFEKVSEKIPLSQMQEKYNRILKYCERETDSILKLFRRQKDDPPVPKNFTPISGRVKWCRALENHLGELVASVSEHHVLNKYPSAKDIENRYNGIRVVLKDYEQELLALWCDQEVNVADASLLQPLLSIHGTRISVNLHITIPLLIREAFTLAKMDISSPIVAHTLLAKQNHFHQIQDSLNVN